MLRGGAGIGDGRIQGRESVQTPEGGEEVKRRGPS